MATRLKMKNPIGFTPLPVTLIASVVYLALLTTLLVIHLVVPPAPSDATPFPGVNITEAWQDLRILSNGFHPYNSHRNDEVRAWLLRRIESIVKANGAPCKLDPAPNRTRVDHDHSGALDQASVVLFNDITSNLTFSTPIFGEAGLSIYFEGTNIIVYIRGSEDDQTEWWKSSSKPGGHGGVLVNAHYDSVSTGYGATDDGIGVVTVLQLIKYFSTVGQQPKKGIVALLNNGEEDYLNGARAFALHPMSKFTHTFLNLEGTGGGNRALLFRTTDTEITRAYGGNGHPFGTVASADGFKRGIIRSQTDYVVFNGDLGMRGLDVAFIEPRSRYHTDQDDVRHSNVDSLWHMLSGALSTVQYLTNDLSATFEGETDPGKVPSGKGSDGVWFDVLGRAFAVFQLHTLFAITVTLLAATPAVLIAVFAVLYRMDRLYLFSALRQVHSFDGDETIGFGGWRGFFRFPIIFIVTSASLVGLAFLITKFNPFIAYSSPYSIWAMMLSAWIFFSWFFSRVGDSVRPSAFHRTYALLWMLLGAWGILIVIAVFEDHYAIASGYFWVFYFTGLALASLVGLCELFGLKSKAEFVEEQQLDGENAPSVHAGSISSAQLLAPNPEDEPVNGEDEEHEETEPTESTSLLRRSRRTTFANYSITGRGRPSTAGISDAPQKEGVYGYEQQWSSTLPTWTWVLQFLLVAPIAIIFVGQLGLLVVSAMYQTLADGNAALPVYMAIAVFSILLAAPLGPFIHRFTFHVPMFLLCVFTGTLIYNLVSFPFSANNRLKVFFVQKVDLDTGVNSVTLLGARQDYLEAIVNSLPSATNVFRNCTQNEKSPLSHCSWSGLEPRVVPSTLSSLATPVAYVHWLSYNATRVPGRNMASFTIHARHTRACRLVFASPISDVSVRSSGYHPAYTRVPADGAGSRELRLWRRQWDRPWHVTVRWPVPQGHQDGDDGLRGEVRCLWNDDNRADTIPALKEIRRFAPVWVAVTKAGDGLVEGSKAFVV